MINRRQFIASATAAAVGLWLPRDGMFRPGGLPLAFSTLGTPDWEWLRILDVAKANGYHGIELRTLGGTEDLPNRPEFARDQISETRKELMARDLRVVCVGSGASMHESDPDLRTAARDQVRRFVDLAACLDAPFVRVFGDRYPPGEEREAVVERVADGLREAGRYAGERGVTILLESHGDFTDSDSILELLRRTSSDHVALLWDAHHTFVQAREEPEETVRRLGPYIRHVHLKDSVASRSGRRYVLTGTGEVPIRRQVVALVDAGYDGVVSFEWEKRWHPDIEDPEVAIPHFATAMARYAPDVELTDP